MTTVHYPHNPLGLNAVVNERDTTSLRVKFPREKNNYQGLKTGFKREVLYASLQLLSGIARNTINLLKLTPVLSIPFSCYYAAQEISTLSSAGKGSQKSEKETKIDCSLRFSQYVEQIGDSVVTLLNSLQTIGWVAKSILLVTKTLSGVGTLLCLATAALNARQLSQGKAILAQMKRASSEMGDTKKGHVQALESLLKKEVRLIEDNLAVADGKSVKDRVTKIIQVAGKATYGADRASDTLQRTYNLITKRIEQKNFSNKLAILSSVVTFVAKAILLLSPIAPLGYGLFAVAGIITLIKAIKEYREVACFKNNLENVIGFGLPTVTARG